MKSFAEHNSKFRAEIGDRLLVFRQADDDEDGWNTIWVREMDNFVGHEVIVVARDDAYGFLVESCDGNQDTYWVPYTACNIIR